ncbi:putative Integral membrane protein [Streptomyces viridochromogenes Tue57]|uniref:Putative Integral membrane protein n=2 Tax=Streptomyces viridochromogenes TaxID=1938 RepID=L8PEZ0_STRVR|nr:putative Integral membrane protein [Streptomyces viridochromogenes Tue57]
MVVPTAEHDRGTREKWGTAAMSQQQPHASDAAHSPRGSQATRPPSAEAGPPSAAPRAGGHRSAPSAAGWATGGLVFAGVLMLVNGLLAVLQGVSAIAEDEVYGRIGDYVFKASLTAWGVVLLALGVVVAAVGYGILRGEWWARIAGIFVASLSMVAHFLFLPYTPVWSVIMVGIDFFVILALAAAPDAPGASPRGTR